MSAVATFDPSRKLDLFIRVGMDGSKTFSCSDTSGSPKDISDLTFNMKIYERIGGDVYLNWTQATEISRPDDFSFTVTYTDTVSQGIRPHKYFYIITRTDSGGLIRTWLNGFLTAHEGEFDGVTETTNLIINDAGEYIAISINDTTNGASDLQEAYDNGNGIIQLINGKPLKIIDQDGNQIINIDENRNVVLGYIPTYFAILGDNVVLQAVGYFAMTADNMVIITSANEITDAASILLNKSNHVLTTSQSAITVTDSFGGDYRSLTIYLSGVTSVVLTFSQSGGKTNLCRFEGTSSGDNTMTITGVSGDKIEISGKKIGDTYSYIGINMGQ